MDINTYSGTKKIRRTTLKTNLIFSREMLGLNVHHKQAGLNYKQGKPAANQRGSLIVLIVTKPLSICQNLNMGQYLLGSIGSDVHHTPLTLLCQERFFEAICIISFAV
jgi:hypothetical protein